MDYWSERGERGRERERERERKREGEGGEGGEEGNIKQAYL